MFWNDKSRLNAVEDREAAVVPVAPAPGTRRRLGHRSPDGPLAVYAIDDLASLTEEQIAVLISQAGTDARSGARPCSHLVITCDLVTGIVHHFVPCSSGLEALRKAQTVITETRAGDPHARFTVQVTPLLPH